jgi:hypothetical protein
MKSASGRDMLIRSSGWSYPDQDPPRSGPLYTAAVVLLSAWAVVLTLLLGSLVLRFL